RRREATLCWNALDETWKRSQYPVCGRRRPCRDDGGTRAHHHPTPAPVRGPSRDRADDDGHRRRCRCRIGTAARLRTARARERPAAPDSTVLTWVEENSADDRAETIRAEIGQQPMARWFGSWSGPIAEATDAFTAAAQEQGALPVMVAYNISGRDACGGHSGG